MVLSSTLDGSLLSFKFLEDLHLENNKITNLQATLNILCRLQYLKHLELYGNPLAEEADYFHPITREDWFVYKKPNQRSWDKKNGAKTSTTKAPNVTPNIMPSTAIPSSKPNTAKPNITKPNITTPQNPPKIASSPKPKEIPLPKTTDTPKIIKSKDISKTAVSVPTKTNEKTISAKPSKKQKIITKSVKKSSPTKKKVEKS